MRSKVVLFEQIRRDSRVEGLSVRALAQRYKVHRRTVRQALASAVPPKPARRVWQKTVNRHIIWRTFATLNFAFLDVPRALAGHRLAYLCRSAGREPSTGSHPSGQIMWRKCAR